jgi:GNAT superfamily N-acetyltransferase
MPCAFAIRRATLHDVDALVRLRFQLFRETGDLQSDEAAPELAEITRTYLTEMLPTEQFLAWIAETEEGEIIATSGVVFFTKPPTKANPHGREAYIMNMYTVPQWRSKGIATALLRALIQFVTTTTEAKRIWLHTTREGQSVYEKCGFVFTTDDMEYVWEQGKQHKTQPEEA